MMTTTGAGFSAEERGHWYSPAAVEEMVAAERERCAKVCEREALRWNDPCGEPAEECAALIRGA
jgi:hypothetical protein